MVRKLHTFRLWLFKTVTYFTRLAAAKINNYFVCIRRQALIILKRNGIKINAYLAKIYLEEFFMIPN